MDRQFVLLLIFAIEGSFIIKLRLRRRASGSFEMILDLLLFLWDLEKMRYVLCALIMYSFQKFGNKYLCFFFDFVLLSLSFFDTSTINVG